MKVVFENTEVVHIPVGDWILAMDSVGSWVIIHSDGVIEVDQIDYVMVDSEVGAQVLPIWTINDVLDTIRD